MKKIGQNGFVTVEIFIIVAVVISIAIGGWYIFVQNNEPKADDENIMVQKWGVSFPQTKLGKFSVLQPQNEPELTQGGPADMEVVSLKVNGFDASENKCVLPFETGQIYRHKEKNPTIHYNTTFVWQPVAEVQIGDWWYSTKGLAVDGNCFEGISVSQEYKDFAKQFLSDFKKITATD